MSVEAYVPGRPDGGEWTIPLAANRIVDVFRVVSDDLTIPTATSTKTVISGTVGRWTIAADGHLMNLAFISGVRETK